MAEISTYYLYMLLTEKWGEVVNGSWVGMLGDVWRGEKNLTFNYFAITEERAKDFDYSVPYYNEGWVIAWHLMTVADVTVAITAVTMTAAAAIVGRLP